MKHRSIFFHGLAWLVLSLHSGAAAPANSAASDPAQSTPPIPWNALGAKVTAQYSGDGLAVNARADGAQLRCVFQKLEGEVTRQGLWLSSTAPESSDTPFRVLAASLGRERGVRCTLPATGTIETTVPVARFIRSGLVEEYSVSVDGMRQDFVLPERLPGEGTLRVELNVSGATAEASPDGVRLTLEHSGRKLNYHRLRATDATGRELTARMEVVSTTQLAVIVEDGGAVYPIRIDPTFCDANWSSMGGLGGTDDAVYAAVMDASGNLYIGGDFSIVGDVFANRIAKWDGSRWSALGSGMEGGFISRVSALAVSGPNLYAAGFFTTAGGIPANSIAKWNGSSWSALSSGLQDSGITGTVTGLAISGSDLYAGGSFRAAGGGAVTNIAKWNGSSWSALGSGVDNTVGALAVSGADLYAGGQFTTAGGITANCIAKWNGSSWSALGSGMATGPGIQSYVNALAVMGSDLYAAGYFRTAGGTPAISIAKWNGSSWSALGSGLAAYLPDPDFPVYDPGTVSTLVVSGSDLYAGGSFAFAGDTDVEDIAKWNGSNWSNVGGLDHLSSPNSRDSGVSALVISGTRFYAGGWFLAEGVIRNVAEWNGSSWSALPEGMTSLVGTLAVLGSDLYAGGDFRTADGYGHIAKWNGTGWSILPSEGMSFSSGFLAVSGSDLITVGMTELDGLPFRPGTRVVKWNGSSWSALGPDFSEGERVNALAASGGNLYVTGWFTATGGVAATNIIKWNGSSWSALGSGSIDTYVFALAGSGPDLYAAGSSFTSAGGIPAGNFIAKWNGSTWSALGSGITAPLEFPYFGGRVTVLAVSGGDLYAGGWFTTVDGIAANNIAKWNGNRWSALGSGISAPLDERYYGGRVVALAASGGDLYAGGAFTTVGGIAANSFAKWNGSSWSALGSGVSGVLPNSPNPPFVGALAVAGTALYAGGEFLAAGGKVSANIARARLGIAPLSFADWVAGCGLSGAGAADADPDGDGLPNGLEYILGGNPGAPDPSLHPAITLSGGNMLFTFPRHDSSETPDVTLTVEAGTDLLNWPSVFHIGPDTASSSPGVSVTENGPAPDSITVVVPIGTDRTKFARLKVIISP